MSSLMWYIFDFARKAWADAFANAKSEPEISEKPERFRDFPKVNKEYCIGCGACTVSCPSPNAIKLVRDEDTEEGAGMTYPVIKLNIGMWFESFDFTGIQYHSVKKTIYC